MYPNLMLVGVESIAESRGFYSDLVMMDDINGRPLPLFPVKRHIRTKRPGKPENRYEEWLAPRYQMGRIRVPDVLDEFGKHFKDEWLTYPNGQHDDCLDAVYILSLVAEGELADKTTRSSGTMNEEDSNPFAGFGRRRRKKYG